MAFPRRERPPDFRILLQQSQAEEELSTSIFPEPNVAPLPDRPPGATSPGAVQAAHAAIPWAIPVASAVTGEPSAQVPVAAPIVGRAVSVPPSPISELPYAAPTTPPAPIPIGPGLQSAASPSVVQPAARPVVPLQPSVQPTERQRKAASVAVVGRPSASLAAGASHSAEEPEELDGFSALWQKFVENSHGWAVSFAFHLILVIALLLLRYVISSGDSVLTAILPSEDAVQLDELEPLVVEGPKVDTRGGDLMDRLEPEPLQPMIDGRNAMEGIDAAGQELAQASVDFVPFNDVISKYGSGTGLLDQYGTGKGKKGTGYGLNGTGLGLGGRGGRRGKAIGDGATKESEAAVDLALKWLAEHQLPDGGWSFNHHLAPSCQGKCPNVGEMPDARIAATALALLPFLGAGQTNQVGRYQKTVAGGLNYLIARMQMTPDGGALNNDGGPSGGRMYAHGLATIALCEAYGMQMSPQDLQKLRGQYDYAYDGSGEAHSAKKQQQQEPIPIPNLGRAAQAALNFVMSAQAPNGGWRYNPRQQGDTSVVGWQLMGLMSGRMAYLRVNPNSFVGASHFLDSVQRDDYGADYGYTDKTRGSRATQAIGLLCRMYLGWKRDHPGIVAGVQQLSEVGPRHGDMYYNYYATQVLHHYGGVHWEQWNPRMRDSLVAAQSKEGHTAGSWHFPGGDHGATSGGRLYCTAMAAMTLEVYYRHMPLYREGIFEGHGGAKQEEQEKDKEAQRQAIPAQELE